MENAPVTACLTGKEIMKIDSLISAGLYTTNSDFLRYAARHLLRDEAPEIPALFLRMQSRAKEMGLAKDEILKNMRSMRHRLYRETFGDD